MKILYLILLLFSFNSFSKSNYRPLIIGHRGASGYRPEHTLPSYELAISMGADYIEPDLVMSKDGELVIRHENEISETTDVAIKFPERKTTKIVDGKELKGWFTEDFTLKELKTLRAKERLEFRNHEYDGKFEILSFVEFLDFVKNYNLKNKNKIGIYVETKHPTYFESIELPLESKLIMNLKEYGFLEKNSKVFIQSFELEILKKLKSKIKTPLIYLVDDPELIPFDNVKNKDSRTYLDMMKKENLLEIKKVAYGIGPYKRYILPEDKEGNLLPETSLIKIAHELNLKVHPYTFRNESKYLNKSYQNLPSNEYHQFFKLGVDGLFTDFTDTAVDALKTFKK